jgi:thioredoxin 1
LSDDGLIHLDMLNDIRDAIENNPRVLIEFGAVWCIPCRSFLPHFTKFAEKHPEYLCVKVDVDVDPAVVSEFNILSVPTLKLFSDGHLVGDIKGRTVVQLEKEILD